LPIRGKPPKLAAFLRERGKYFSITKNQQIADLQKAFSEPHLVAFFVPQKTELSGGSAACATG
jgi:hypothetical protein